MTIVRTRSRFSPDPICAQFPGLLSFSGSPPDGAGTTDVAGEVDGAALLQAVNRQIAAVDPDQLPADLVEATKGPRGKRRIRVPWRWCTVATALGAAAGEVQARF